MDAKDTWPVVKFLIAATGFKRRDARKMLEEIPEEHYSRLFVVARAWDRDQAAKASDQLSTLLGDSQVPTLMDATRLAQSPSGTDADDEEDTPAPKKSSKKSRK